MSDAMVEQKTISIHKSTLDELVDWKFESRSDTYNEAVAKLLENAD